MTLTELLAALPMRLPRPEANEKFERGYSAVKDAFSDVEPTIQAELDTLVKMLAASISKDAWDELAQGDVATVLRAFASRSVDLPQSVESFLWRELSSCTRPNLLDALCESFIHEWAPNDERTRRLARVITARSDWLSKRHQNVFRTVPELFDLESGAISFGRWMVQQPNAFDAVRARGVNAPHDVGFMAYAHAAWLESLPQPTSREIVDKVFAWITPSVAEPLIGDRGAAAVSRLLSPWRQSMPKPDLRAYLVERLMIAYGDPRNENPHFWDRVGGEGKRVMLRWLAGRRLEAFIEVVSLAEDQGSHGSQWANRRSFWMGLYEQGLIDEAWVAFTKPASAHAIKLFKKTGDLAYSHFGERVGARLDTCILIMHIGRYVVVEGSHSFRIHVFTKTDSKAPKLYGDSYDVDDFLLPVEDTQNTQRHIGDWMSWVRRRVL